MTNNIDNKSLRFAFVGDVSFGDCLFCQGMGVRSLARHFPPDHFFIQVAEYFQRADIAFCNLETVLTRSGEDENQLASVDMRGDPECIESLNYAGFSVINVANNHSAQHGPIAFQETIDLLKSKDIEIVGLRADQCGHSKPVIIDKKGKKIGILGYSFVHDRGFSKETPYAAGEDEKILTDIKKLRNSVDLLVVSVHWGLEFMDYPSPKTVQLAHSMVDAGVDIIIGHHPHVLQGIETYKNSIIAYSLGNFLFDMLWSREYRETIILEISWQPNIQLGWSVIPAQISSSGQLIVLTGSQKEWALQRLISLSQNLSYINKKTNLTDNAYEKEFKKKMYVDRIKSYIYFLINFHKYKKQYLLQQIRRTFESRVEDFLEFFKHFKL